MIYGVYSVRDVNVGYGVPVTQENDAVAMRTFENGCSDKRSVWYTHCSDFHLERIGSFNTDTGELVAEPPTRICSASDFVSMMKNGGDFIEI